VVVSVTLAKLDAADFVLFWRKAGTASSLGVKTDDTRRLAAGGVAIFARPCVFCMR
jgi:hypothetical protein